MMRILLAAVMLVALASGPTWAQCAATLGESGVLSGSEITSVIATFGPFFGDSWTLCIAPGVYELDPSDGWPVTLPASYTPAIVGADGAEATILIGDGVMDAFILEDGARGRFDGLTFRDFRTPVSGEVTASLEFKNSVVEYCTYGLSADQDGAVVAGNTARYNELRGIGYGYYASVSDNHVHDNDATGISAIFGGSIEYNIVENNGGAGISAYGVGQQIEHNVIRGNAVGVRVGEQTSLSVNNNDLYSNIDYELLVAVPGYGSVDATSNWWGTTDPGVISAHIHDCLDDPELVTCVVYDPWCQFPGCEGVTSVEQGTWGNIKALYRR
jgi:hypothetical protein